MMNPDPLDQSLFNIMIIPEHVRRSARKGKLKRILKKPYEGLIRGPHMPIIIEG